MKNGLHSRLQDISAFVYTVETGSFTAAAIRMGISKSAPGKSVARLEDRLGIKLLNRTTRSLSLTNAGLDYYQSCLRVLDELNSAESLLSSRKREVSGSVRINLPVSFGRLRIMPVLKDVASLYPALEMDVSFTDCRIDLVEERVDLVVRLGDPGNSANLNARALGFQHSVVCAAPGYLLRRGLPHRIEDLSQHDCLGFANRGRPLPWVFLDREGKAKPYNLTYRHIISNGEALRDAAVSGMGIAYVATWLAAEEIHAGKLTAVPLPTPPNDIAVTALWPRSRDLAPKVRVVVDALIGVFLPVAPWDTLLG
ncbi:LysR family transcriptional regulator [Sodalis sp. RH21]|uniref:LysR family transcriptional regulator n=1 Tax=unclassified Sodalis (in: enterobacteria) TaxID=2636512 RepID=UPI0039B56F68